MKSRLFGLLAVVVLMVAPTTVFGQGYVFLSSTGSTLGVDMPLFDFGEYFDRDAFDAGSLNASYSLLRMDNYSSSLPPEVETTWLQSNGGAPNPYDWDDPAAPMPGPAVYRMRPTRASYKESITYNGIDWRRVTPPAGTNYSTHSKHSSCGGRGQVCTQVIPTLLDMPSSRLTIPLEISGLVKPIRMILIAWLCATVRLLLYLFESSTASTVSIRLSSPGSLSFQTRKTCCSNLFASSKLP